MLILTVLGGSGHPPDEAGAFVLQARATALNELWTQMAADGVEPGDLAPIESELWQAERTRAFGVALVFWWPESRAIVDRWEAQTAEIWSRSMDLARASARIADLQLHRALGFESFPQRKARVEALATAATPADLIALRSDWQLQARLVPIDRRIAAGVQRLAAQVAHAKALGIVSDPAPSTLARASDFASLEDQDRLARARLLTRDLGLVEVDLDARLAAATGTTQAFKRAADEISVAGVYGINVAGYQVRVDGDRRTFASATTAARFNALTQDLDQIVAALKHEVDVVLSQIHVISGVVFYRQTHALSCEEAAVSMALTHQGIYLSQDQILAEMGADRRPMYRDSNGVVRWGNPYQSFVGSVDGSESNYTGYQANYPPLVRVAQAHGARIIAYGYMTAATIYARVAAGHPVVVWATWDWAWHPRHDYLSFDGRWIPWIGPTYASHVYTVVGEKPGVVLVNDPIRGQYWVGKAAFQAAYSDFMEAIVFA